VSSIYAGIPDPTPDVSNLAEVARAIKLTLDALVTRAGVWDAAIEALQTQTDTIQTTVDSDADPDVDPDSQYGYVDARYDKILDDAVDRARSDMIQAMSDFQTALEAFKRGYVDSNALVKAKIESLIVEMDGVKAQVIDESLVRASSTMSLAGRIQSVGASLGRTAAAVSSEAVARATADTAIAARIDSVVAITGSFPTVFIQSTTPTATAVGDLWIDTGSGNAWKIWTGSAWVLEGDATLLQALAAVLSEQIARVDADSAIATDVTSVQAQTDDGTAYGMYRLVAAVSPSDGASSEYQVQVRAVSGSTAYNEAGMRIQAFSDGTRRIKFNTDQFIIYDGATNITPFSVVGGSVYITDLIVETSNIDAGAVTAIEAVENVEYDTPVLSYYTPFATIDDMVLTGEGSVYVHAVWSAPNGASVFYLGGAVDYTANGLDWTVNAALTGQDVELRITNGTNTYTSETLGLTLWIGGTTQFAAAAIFDAVAAGTYDIQLRAKTDVDGRNAIRTVRLIAMEMKR